MEGTEAYHRTGHQYPDDYDIPTDDEDIDYDADSGSDYGADQEDNDEFPDTEKVVVDPGHFRYNKKMVFLSLPCAVMVLTLVGEIFLMAVSFGAGVIIILDPRGEKKRCVVLFISLFVFCHCLAIYSILPLLWLSVLNIFLIAVVNMYIILTGGLCVVQFAFFRKKEQALCVVIERMLFTLYPWCCVILLTWATSSVISWELVPYALLGIGFVYLQMFLTPHTSSFKADNSPSVEEEAVADPLNVSLNILPEVISLTMAIFYCLLPSALHLALHIINNPFRQFLSFTVMLHLVFIFSLSIVLTSLMSVRGIFDYTGWQYKYVLYSRWVCGFICTALVYPILVHYQLSSHFLPWLPAGVALYAVYGALLSEKRFKTVCLLCLPLPCLLFGYWLTWLPWKIEFAMTFGLQMTSLYLLLLVNCSLCFLCVYSCMYWPQAWFELLLVLQSAVFTCCEALLYGGGLYPRSFLLVTAVAILYTLHRLYVSGKLSLGATTVCASLHVTKSAAVIIYHVLGTDDTLTVYRCCTLFLLAAVVIATIAMETKQEQSVTKVFAGMAALSFAIVVNTRPILHLLCIYVLWEEPTSTDIMGLCITTCGACIVAVGSLQLPSGPTLTAVRQMGVVAVSLGVLILVLQPSLDLSGSSLLQWGDLGSVILVAFVLLTDRLQTVQQLFVAAALAGICPGIRFSVLLYSETEGLPAWVSLAWALLYMPACFSLMALLFIFVKFDLYNETEGLPAWVSLTRALLYMPACFSLIALLFIFVKFEVVGKVLDKCILSLCGCLTVLSVLLLFIDLGYKEKKEAVMSLPAWRLLLLTSGAVSVSLKILSTTQDLLIPMVEEKREKEVPRLPFIGNVASVLTFLLACIQSPARGLLHDIWCCAAALILLCLQKDKRLLTNIRQENQIVPTMFVSILVLFLASIVRSDLWDSSGLSFLRAFVEIATILSVTPMFYMLWGILWSSALVLSEQVVVFLLPLNAVYLLYGSTYTSQALGVVGLYAGLWMMATKLPLLPHTDERR